MNIHHFETPIPYIIINDLFDNDELNLIWEELKFLGHKEKLFSPEDTRSASKITENNEKILLKKNNGVWVDHVYTDRKFSNILSLNRKIYSYRQFIWLNHPHWFFKQDSSYTDTTLISYYENSDYYHSHRDEAYFTCITWFFNNPKRFEGGNLFFDDYDTKIEVKNNKAVIFPSTINHSVDEIKMSSEYQNKGMGRFSMTQFVNFS